ncbi:YhcN/YlaJ family sporulation lipoprotein [Defluviitalea raffinosedens]|uniref:YhcN/YlaJ family sporulation lipoprotein n=1 Tax=Defluviitalea raffinosedens TaxID=1450156 RepID=A0A7C8LL23_9FIRM|nr:YhcN/YlaJ family sporulation lipoprotein [Defluviitalea raffinosedens]KAE9637004.1 YhcN/YlaJ family sporulation lipoprotein [Defluviitalea raffinosedens]
MPKSKYLIGLIYIFIITACSANNTINSKSIQNRIENSEDQYNTSKIEAKGSMEEFKRTNPYNVPEQVEKNNIWDIQYSSERAKHIARIITTLPKVEKATVIVMGNIALVGVELDHGINEEEVEEAKTLIEEKTFLADASLKNVAVTASPELVKRITSIAQDLNNGKPIDGLAEELGSIIRRITPIV